MTNKREIKEAIANFIAKVSTSERYIEIKRQLLCDMNDFEPYVAFKRLTRSENSKEITEEKISKFQKETLLQPKNYKIKRLIKHYSTQKSKKDCLSYKDFLEIVLPREHPDLRAFITQRECFDIAKEEYLSYQTEVSMANLLEQEINIFSELSQVKRKLDKLNFNAERIIDEIDKVNGLEINFCNLQEYLTDCGIVVHDFELIGFLRRLDRDDDGVIKVKELARFLNIFDINGNRVGMSKRNIGADTEALKSVSPARKIVSGQISLISKSRKSLLSSKSRELLKAASSCFSKKKSNFKKKQTKKENGILNEMGEKCMSSFALSTKRNERALTVTSENFKEKVKKSGTKLRNFTERSKISRQEGNIFRERFNASKTTRSNLSDIQSNLSSKYDRYACNLIKKIGESENTIEESCDDERSLYSDKSSKFGNLKDSTFLIKQHKSKKNFEKKKETNRIHFGDKTPKINKKEGSLAYQRSIERLQVFKQSKNRNENKIVKIDHLYSKFTQSSDNSKEIDEELPEEKRQSMGILTSISLQKRKTDYFDDDKVISSKEILIKESFKESSIQLENSEKENDPPKLNQDLPLQMPAKEPKSIHEIPDTYTYSYTSFKKQTPTKKLNFSSKKENIPESLKKKKNPLQEIKLHSLAKKNPLLSKPPLKPEPELKQSITLTIQTSPTFKRPQSTARWAENDSMMNIKVESNLNSVKTPGFENEEWRPNFDTNGLSPNQSGIDFNDYAYINEKSKESHSSGISNDSETPRTGFRRIFENDFHPPKLPCNEILMKKKKFESEGGLDTQSESQSLQGVSIEERVKVTNKIRGFLSLILDLIQLEKEFEMNKRELALDENFSLKHTFKLICGNEKDEKFNLKELQTFLKDNGIFESKDLIYLLEAFNYYDQSNMNILSYQDLVEILSPLDGTLSLLLTQRSNSLIDKPFNDDTVEKLKNVFQSIFKIFKKIKELKNEVKNLGLDLDVIFEELDLFGRGYLTKMDFERIVNQVDKEFSESEFQEIGLFVRRIDLDKDVRVSYKDFYLFFNN